MSNGFFDLSIGARLRALVGLAGAAAAAPVGLAGAGLGWPVAAGAALAGFAAVAAVGLPLAASIARRAREAEERLRTMAGGADATVEAAGSGDEIDRLLGALAAMQRGLGDTVGKVREAAQGIAQASTEIAQGNNDLSGRTESTASSLQQTASSMAHLTTTVGANAESARQANQLALSASEVADRGNQVVGQVVARMDAISESSRKIAEIIGVIDGIAFQTNILALNAAVEAARAGEQGRGFAVVAGEVRSLAQRSAQAAREIKELISGSVEQVESGSRLVRDAGATMNEIMGSVRRVTDIIGEISAATQEQNQELGQINGSIGQLDEMTQQNAALVEQSTAAAESLKEQAEWLKRAIGGIALDAALRQDEAASADRRPVVAARGPAAAPVAVPPSRAARHAAGPAATAPGRAAATPASRTPAPAPRPAASAPVAAKGSVAGGSDDDWETF